MSRLEVTAEQVAGALGLDGGTARKLVARFGGWSPTAEHRPAA
ncbi:hypothetical protein [Streptomyces sp. NPDC048637]